MKFGSLDDGEDGEHNGVGFSEVSEICLTHDSFFTLETTHLKEFISMLHIHKMSQFWDTLSKCQVNAPHSTLAACTLFS